MSSNINLNNFTLISQGKICPYCLSPTVFSDSIEVYGTSYGMIYICRPCSAYVGVHKGTTNALGRLGNAELRELKKQAHRWFDPIAREGLIKTISPDYIVGLSNRNKAYRWLAKKMGIQEQYCHIGMFDVDECKKVIEICKPIVTESWSR